MIRTLQDHGIHQGMDVFMEFTIVGLIKDGARVAGAFAYDRERGLFHLFRAKAVVIGTGGIGRAFKITSNSWEYTGDGDAMAYDAGADLMDMEFVQFHPTGMVWPLSVAGILVTEACAARAESWSTRKAAASCSTTSRRTTARRPPTTKRKAGVIAQGDKNARRPPELLTRDHVARCIVREIKEGRGSPHGGVFLDIAWIKKRLPNAEQHIKRKAAQHVPSVHEAGGHRYHQGADGGRSHHPLHDGWGAG